MRPSNKSRSRNKPGGNGNHQNNNQRQRVGNIINRVFESAGPDGKVRGTPQQIIDKYQALARDAQVSGDRVAAESYLQHSEHYSRLLGEAQRQQMENRSFQQQEREDGGPRGDDGFEQRQQQPRPQPLPVASGLTTIDADDGDYMGGPIETPEGRRQPAGGPAPVVELALVESPRQPDLQPEVRPQPAPVPEPASERVSEEAPVEPRSVVDAPPEAPRRPRPRRRKTSEAPAAAAPQAE